MGSSPGSWVIDTQPNAVLGEPANVELQLELVAEEAAEAVHQDHVEHWRRWSGIERSLSACRPMFIQ
jgi:hypothetical protein